MEIQEGNKLIAEFMKAVFKNEEDGKVRVFFQKGFCPPVESFNCWSGSMKYHESWDWLMPVVEKIERDFCNEFEIIIYSSSCYISKWDNNEKRWGSFISGTGKKIDAVRKAVIEFINWYNTQKDN